MTPTDQIADLFTFPNFVPDPFCNIDDASSSVQIILHTVERPQKVSAIPVVASAGMFTRFARVWCVICQRRASMSPWSFRCVGCIVLGAV